MGADPAYCDGLWDIGTCAVLIPVSISLPHFLYANSKITSKVEGMRPDPDKHEFYLYMNPTIGTPVWADARIQANIATQSHSFLSGFGSVPKSIYPLLWIEAGFFPGEVRYNTSYVKTSSNIFLWHYPDMCKVDRP